LGAATAHPEQRTINTEKERRVECIITTAD